MLSLFPLWMTAEVFLHQMEAVGQGVDSLNINTTYMYDTVCEELCIQNTSLHCTPNRPPKMGKFVFDLVRVKGREDKN